MRERERCAAAQVAGTAALDLQLGSRVGRERAAGGGGAARRTANEKLDRSWSCGRFNWVGMLWDKSGWCEWWRGFIDDDFCFVTFCSISSSSITLMMIQILTFSVSIISFGKFCPPNAPSAVYFQSNSPRTFDSSNKHLSDATKITKFESSNCEKCALILLISSAFKWILTSFQADARQNKSNQNKCVEPWSRRAVFGVA